MKPLGLFAGSASRRSGPGPVFNIMVIILALLPCFSLGLFSSLSLAADSEAPKVIRRTSSEAGGTRVALIIGNKDYKDVPLRNPVNDAEDLGQVLKRLGFSVTTRTNVNRREFEEAVDQFSRQIAGAEVAVFYFSGHGCQAQGENYLVPVGDVFNDEADLRYRAVNAGLVLDKMEEAKPGINIVILDACRNNPFKGVRSASRGLTALQAARGSFIAYATAPGKVASDGQDRNSVYTKHLLRAIESGGLDILQAFQRVAVEVDRETNGGQVPWFSSALMGSFSFNPSVASVPPPRIAPPRIEEARIPEPPAGYSDEAKRLFKLAWQGEAEAQSSLGDKYYEGDGVAKDRLEALKWYRKAVEQNYETAKQEYRKLGPPNQSVAIDYKALKQFRKIMMTIEESHLTQLGESQLIDGAIEGMLQLVGASGALRKEVEELGQQRKQRFGSSARDTDVTAKDYSELIRFRKAMRLIQKQYSISDKAILAAALNSMFRSIDVSSNQDPPGD
jgi:hypothetical protein